MNINNKLDEEMSSLNFEITEMNQRLSQNLSAKDGRRIWKHFQRFAEYEDLKDLYNRVIPEIAKFEEKIINYERDVENSKCIIR